MPIAQRESPTVEALFDPGGRVSFQKIVPVEDRGPLGCVGCRRVIDGSFDVGEGFFVEYARPDGSASGGMVVCAECMAYAVAPLRIINARQAASSRTEN